MLRKINLCLAGLMLLTSSLLAQSNTSGFDEATAMAGVCVWDMTGMFQYPGQESPFIETITFGQEVRSMGDSSFVSKESAMYHKVKSESGKVGWVNQSHFVTNASPVALLTESMVYNQPNSPTSATGELFLPGDLAAMRDFQDGWIFLIGEEKKKQGWVEWAPDQEIVSVDDEDLIIGSLLMKAREEEDPAKRVAALESIRQQPNFYRSSLSDEVTKELEETAQASGQAVPAQSSFSAAAPATATAAYQGTSGSSDPLGQLSQPASSSPPPEGVGTRGLADMVPVEDESAPEPQVTPLPGGGTLKQEPVFDTETQISYMKMTETGSILPVTGPSNWEDIYFCYHKTLPKGARVLLNVPDNPGFVVLQVVNRLGKDRPQVIGLHPKCIEAVYGPNTNNPQAQMMYFIRQ